MWDPIYQISGTVTRIDDGGMEPADRNWYRFVLTLLLAIFISFFLFAWWLLTRRSPLRGLFYGYFLFGRGQNMIPVWYFRVRDSSLNEYIVRIKGYIDTNVVPGDKVEVFGRMRNSVVHLSGGKNLTTGALFKLRKK